MSNSTSSFSGGSTTTISTSRVIVKNLPKYATAEMLKRHFGTLAGVQVTDAKLMTTETGRSRRFGFVGFRTGEEARRAVDHFHRSFLDTCRLEVALALPIGSTDLPRAWSKHYQTQSTNSDNKTRQETQSKNPPLTTESFLASIDTKKSSSRKRAVWDNDADAVNTIIAAVASVPTKDQSGQECDESDYETNYALQSKRVQRDELAKDSLESEPESQEEACDGDKEEMDTSRLFVRNLAFTCSKEELQELFSPFGTVTDVHIPLSRDSKFPKGLAYITCSTPQEAIAAYERLDGTTFQGRLVHILPCKKATPTSAVLDKGSKKVLESQKKKLKVQVSNPLYMQEQTIVSSIAAHLAVGKQNVLNADHESSGNLAVKLAISEASLQASLITYLERAGINLQALFNDGRTRKKKSDTILVCKNVVPGVTEEELVRLLTRHGRLSRLVFPPHSTLAVCEFLDPVDAKRAYTHLLGSNLRSQPLLLEFAPEDTFALSHDPPSQEPLVKVPNHTNANEGANQDDTEYKVEGMSSRTLFVKNISFRTTEQGLKDFFTGKDLAVKSVKIPQSKLSNAKRSSSHHAGFGFVEFASEQQCKLALDKLQDAQLDGHQLSLSVSCQNTVAAANSSQGPKAIDKALNAVAKEPPSDQAFRLLVKNVPFEATAEDVRDLFRAFVRVKRVKLPRKLLGKQHRGFAFVDCATPREAIEAMRTLSRAHLYGRHLVLEWAADQGTAATLASHPMHGQDLDDNNNVVDHNSHGDGESDLQIYDE